MYKYGILALKARYESNLLRKRNYLYESMAKMDAQVQRTLMTRRCGFCGGRFTITYPASWVKRLLRARILQRLLSFFCKIPNCIAPVTSLRS